LGQLWRSVSSTGPAAARPAKRAAAAVIFIVVEGVVEFWFELRLECCDDQSA
jgi:hypothetical protein